MFTADDKYTRHDRENLRLPLQTHLSKIYLAIFYCVFGIYI